ncbi:SLIT-ROBO Rho GTPase-activating protein 1-like, partial [Hemiscyllium ocellatum]|uniref:SLIT-ROBO Rho GTPase-activating protein 1-like n=1 Tax=Hemiscyllium ocellatum TaxID=170820 RepID=UPI00296604E7
LHHEGLFRIPGSQSEVNDIRNAFERGEDPLDTMNEHNLDSVAGVLKLYFRGLSKPIFPVESFSCLIACVETEDLLERAHKIKAVVSTLEPSIVIVIRYLFAFLHHVSQYSDENMMDAHNLAVCFGPTLVTVPADQDPVSSQGRVNEVVKTIIVHHDRVFPGSELLPGPIYEKCMTQEEDYCDSLQSDNVIEECEQDVLLDIHGSEDDSPGGAGLRAMVLFDYVARSVSELSLRKGESLRLLQRVSDDWWRGETSQGTGLVPDKYIQLPDTVDAGSGPWPEPGSELGSTEERPDSSRDASLSDPESDPVPRRRSGSSPIRRRFPDGALRIPVFQPTAPRPLRSPALEERLGLGTGIQERRNTLDLYQLTHSPRPVRTAAGSAGKLDRQHSERPATEVNKDMVRNMDSVFRELLQHRRHKSSSEEVQDPRRAETPGSQGTEVRRSSSGAIDRPPTKQGPPSKQGVKARATALFKPSGGGTGEGAP